MITEPASTADQEEIGALVRDVTRSMFTPEKVRAGASGARGYDEAAWRQLVDLGWAGIALPAHVGGESLGAVIECLVHRELGGRLAPSPYLATAGFSAAALAWLGDETADALMSALATGTKTAALVLGHGRGWPTEAPAPIVVRNTSQGSTIDGRAELVLDGARADVLVVVAQSDAGTWGLFEVEAQLDSVTRTPVPSVDSTRTVSDIVFSATPAHPLSRQAVTTNELASLVDRLVVPLSAEMAGAATACVGLTLDYLRARHQFGRPIGSFQALKHRCAEMAVAVTVAQEMVFSAAEMVDVGDRDGLRVAAPLALASAGQAFLSASEEAIQMHGGVGFTDEFDIGLYYKRALLDGELIAATADALARMDSTRERGGD